MVKKFGGRREGGRALLVLFLHLTPCLLLTLRYCR